MWYKTLIPALVITSYIQPGLSYPSDVINARYLQCKVPYEGECVPLENCPSIYKALYNMEYLSESYKNKIKESQCAFYGSSQDLKRQVMVCCPHTDTVQDHTTINAVLSQSVQVDNLHCGIANSVPETTEGKGTQLPRYPWMALIEYVDIRDTTRRGFNCTGTLVNNRFVLTAAHCTVDRYWKPHRILLGNWNDETEVNCLSPTNVSPDCLPPNAHLIEIENIIVHSKFPAKLHHDIALIRLRESITYSIYIRPICLPFGYTFHHTQLVHRMAKYVSWGQTLNASVITNRQIDIPLRVWNTMECRGRYKTMDRKIYVKHEICAGGEQNVDTCKGDSGGALLYATDTGFMQVHYLVGVMVGGTQPCGLQGWPNISVNVRSHLEWILNFLVA